MLTPRTVLLTAVRVIVLTIILFVCFGLGGTIAGLEGPRQTPEQAGATALALLLVCLLTTLVLSHIIVRSRWSGVRLMVVVFWIFYGVMTLMSQMETAVFVTRLPAGTVPKLFLMGLIVAAPFSVLSVLILGKRRADAGAEPSSRLIMPRGEWAWKLAVIGVTYVVIYFLFGYFVAWRNPELREYYSGIDEGSFALQMRAVVADTPWLIPFQILRAMIWTAIAVPVIRMMKGSWQETALAVGLLFAVMNVQLLLPNPYMPESVRMSHLVETAPSNFIFGFFLTWLLISRRHLDSGRPRP